MPLPEAPRFCPRCGRALADDRACPADGYRWYADPKVAVGALVEDERGRLLLVRRDHEPARGRWAFPSGYVDAGEVLEAAAAREVLEETGVRARIGRLLGAWSEAGDAVVFLAYAGTYAGGEARPGPETSDVDWFDPGALPPLAFAHDPEVVRAWQEAHRATAAPGAPGAPGTPGTPGRDPQ